MTAAELWVVSGVWAAAAALFLPHTVKPSEHPISSGMAIVGFAIAWFIFTWHLGDAVKVALR